MKRTVSCMVALSLSAGVLFAGSVTAAEKEISVTVAAGEHDRSNVPVKVTLTLPASMKDITAATVAGKEGNTMPAQLTGPSLLSSAAAKEGEVVRELHFIVDQLKAGKSQGYTASLGGATPDPGKTFAWKDTKGEYLELQFGSEPVLRYIYQAFDDSTPERRFETYKVFHHLYSPDGERIVTNGPTIDEPYSTKVRYPHHRGIFYGFSKMSYGDGGRVDLWHCQRDNYQSHEGVLSQEAGPVVGRHRVAIDWHGRNKEVFAKEQREMTVYRVPGGHLVEFASKLQSTKGDLTIDGDPQHAGFQFRAHNDVAAKTSKETYYIRVDGVGKKGQTRNWPGQKDQVNFPWKGMSFVLDGERYTVAYIDRPENPKEARFSERDYGRFGSYFQTEIEGDETLDVNYRLWLEQGEMQPEEIDALSQDFVNPPQVTVK